MKKLITIQSFVLLVGVLFAWTNFTLEVIAYMQKRACVTGCAPIGTHPLLTPCFGGAIFFSIAYILSIMIIRTYKQKQQP